MGPLENRINEIYADPQINDKQYAVFKLKAEAYKEAIAPIVYDDGWVQDGFYFQVRYADVAERQGVPFFYFAILIKKQETDEVLVTAADTYEFHNPPLLTSDGREDVLESFKELMLLEAKQYG